MKDNRNRILTRAVKNNSFKIGAGITVLYLFMALFGSLIAPYSPYDQNLVNGLKGPTLSHPAGWDELGRDMFSRLLAGAKYTIGMGIAAISLSLTIGITLGSIAGFFGGILDTLISRVIDAMLAFPSLLIAIAIVSILGPGFENLIIAISIAPIPRFARLIRGSFLSLREEEYVIAAKGIGASQTRIIVRHILPNALAPLLVQTSYSIAGAILAASGLSFLGLGAQPPTPEWGVMLSRGRGYMRIAPHVVTFPGIFIAVSILGLNLLGDGLRDIFDPKMVNRGGLR